MSDFGHGHALHVDQFRDEARLFEDMERFFLTALHQAYDRSGFVDSQGNVGNDFEAQLSGKTELSKLGSEEQLRAALASGQDPHGQVSVAKVQKQVRLRIQNNVHLG
ncbi:MAG: hypothetical protein R3E01_10020 [Pirellulaceae bacterium]|nr:hypothetical protein [Planctomycetales bacterium]